MNKIRPIHLRRSWLFVGAATENHIDEANESSADVCIQEFVRQQRSGRSVVKSEFRDGRTQW